MHKAARSLTSSFTKNAIAAIIITALLIAVSIIYLEYHQFSLTSKNMEHNYVSSQKSAIRLEINRVFDYIQSRRSEIKSILKQRIKQRVYEAHTIASSIYQQHQANWPDEKIKESIKAALRGLRFFNGDGYYFAHSINGILQLHGLKPKAEGSSRLELQDSKGQYIVKNLIDIVKAKQEGFLSYSYSSFSHPQQEREKLVFVKHFKPYDWLIGSGDYAENIEKIIQQEMIAYINQIRFGENSYIFVVSYNGIVLANPTQKHLVGTNIWELEDPNGVKVTQEERRAVEKPDGDFIYYIWNKPSTSMPSPKVSFMKGVRDWQWMIGTGVYLDDIQFSIDQLNTDLKSGLITKLSILLALSLLAVIAIIYQTQRTSNRIDKERNQIINFFKTASDKSKKIKIDDLHYAEFISLAESVNQMLDKQVEIEADSKKIELQLRQSQKMDALGKIVGGIAHDFNNLLGIMMGYSELLTEQLNKKDKLRPYAVHILEATKRGRNLTRKLLGISSYKEQTANIINLNQLLADNKEIIEKALTSHIKFDLELSNTTLNIYADASDFNDTLLNLCINAMHAMKNSKHARLIIQTSLPDLTEGQLSELELSAGQYVQVSVIDNGTGIDSQVREHIFEPFFTTKGEQGTGLGLSQVYGFMKRSNGAISVFSTPGHGTEISLFFKQHIEPKPTEQ